MCAFLTPPDFFRIFDNKNAVLQPPPIPAAAEDGSTTTYAMFGGTYSVPPVHVGELTAPLKLEYDERCLGDFATKAEHTDTTEIPTVKHELHRLADELRAAIRDLLLAMAEDAGPAEDAATRVHNKFVNISHLLGRLRKNEAAHNVLRASVPRP